MTIRPGDLIWAAGSFCALHKAPFDGAMLLQQFPPPHDLERLVRALRALDFKTKLKTRDPARLSETSVPFIAVMAPLSQDADAKRDEAVANVSLSEDSNRLVIVIRCDGQEVVFFTPDQSDPQCLTLADFTIRFTGRVLLVAPSRPTLKDPDAAHGKPFGFSWFVPELLKHKSVWRDVLLASLVLQLIALATPLFTQAIIDKVVVHRTESTLIAIVVAMAIFMLFTSLLTWARQYLINHTGNRVDAVLGAAVFEHLFSLPPRYFQHRPTGVIAARLHGVETIREFVASAAVTLVLDLPFLLIFVAVMFYYSWTLTLLVLACLGGIAGMCLIAAPLFQARLNQQFLIGARNQAYVTEYIGGLETVKSLQLEPQLRERYGQFLADYLNAGFATKQIANTYNVFASGVEQLMTLLVLVMGAYSVMTGTDFTIGMLVAFQMFSGKLSQPVMRLVGLWQQFQQARLAVARLGDVMNAPSEPYRVTPMRQTERHGLIEALDLGFRYGEDRPFLYRQLSLRLLPGKTYAIMGPSGTGKSTFAKLLQGFYLPTEGQIKIDGVDIRHLAANELRGYFGVVPQETVLFSGTIFDNLQMANPAATFDMIVQACKMAEIHTVIEALPQGYQTEIGERGAGLSGGQKQRIAIARALLKRPKVLIFDEATSNLDADTAEHFARTVNALHGKVTMLFITHALPKALRVDEVVSLSPAERVSRPVGQGERAVL